jgi:pyruvate dehydrogenase E2 component (dihydrolipoamide acetyltransferase)
MIRTGAREGEPAVAKIEVKVPDIGDFKDVPIIEILVKPGDAVTAEQPLLTLESDKATLEVPAPSAGVVATIVAKVGDKVSMGTPLLTLEAEAGAPAAAAPPSPKADAAPAPAPAAPPPAPAPAAAQPARASIMAVDFSGVFAGPAARRLARELDVDLTTIQGTGEKSRITVADVKVAARVGGAAAGGVGLPDVPTVDFAKFGPI